MSPTQCKAARALLNWTQLFLAESSGLSKSTIIDFELGRRDVSLAAQQAMRKALEDGGVIFLKDGRSEGVKKIND